MRAIGKYVLVEEPVVKEQMNELGLYIPEEKREWGMTVKAVAVSVGPKVEDVKVGDTIYYGAKAGETVKLPDMVYRLIPENEIYAVED